MEGYFSTGQSPQWAVVPVEEEEEEEEEEAEEAEEEEEEEEEDIVNAIGECMQLYRTERAINEQLPCLLI
jgi:hypothetical protein